MGVYPSLLSEGGKTELNGEWPFVGHCWKKNRIARTNTWTSLEKGEISKGNMMLVYSRFSVGTGKTKQGKISFPSE
jgi:hypothetical protein